MKIAAMTFRLRVLWVHSLKEKRMIVRGWISLLSVGKQELADETSSGKVFEQSRMR